MSNFLGFESFLIPLGSTVQNIQDTFKTAITAYGWQAVRQAIVPIATLGTFTNSAYAFDGTVSTFAGDGSALPRWLGCQMANPFTPTKMYLQGASDCLTSAPLTFTLDWSDNGSAWTTHQTWTSEILWLAPYEHRVYTITSAPSKNYWRINVTAIQSGSYTYITAWCLENAGYDWISTLQFIDVIPPVTETIGNSVTKEEVRLEFTTTTINIRPVQELLTAFPQLYTWDTAVAGAVTLSITINGIIVSYTGTSGNTAIKNARGLYGAVKASTDSNFLAWDFLWTPTLLSLTAGFYFMATKKVATANITITSSNITTRAKGTSAAPQVQRGLLTQPYTLTIDMVNGFIYYLQVHSRGLALAIKTNAGFYGPCHMCYGSNSAALSQVPISDISAIPLTPIELIVGYDDIISNTGAFGRITHWWMMAPDYSSPFDASSFDGEDGNYCSSIFTKHVNSGQLSDLMSGAAYGWALILVTMRSEGMFSDTDNGTLFPVHRVAADPEPGYSYVIGGSVQCRGVGPVYTGLDWYRYVGTLANEQLVLSTSNDFTTTFTSNALATDVTLNVVSTTGFPTAGYLVADGEVIQYTGITATQFTGCTRGKYATTALLQYAGAAVNIGMWLVKINTGLLFAGYSKPT